jgi:hypothetical protein
MTKEYNDAVKATLTPDGAYLLTFIDGLGDGKFWRAAANTMRKTFPHVHLLYSHQFRDGDGNYSDGRSVYIIYGSDKPFDYDAVHRANATINDGHIDSIRELLATVPLAEPFQFLRSCLDQYSKPIWTHVLEDDQLDMLLKQQKEIILTDQYCPVDNLMSGVFRDKAKGTR